MYNQWNPGQAGDLNCGRLPPGSQGPDGGDSFSYEVGDYAPQGEWLGNMHPNVGAGMEAMDQRQSPLPPGAMQPGGHRGQQMMQGMGAAVFEGMAQQQMQPMPQHNPHFMVDGSRKNMNQALRGMSMGQGGMVQGGMGPQGGMPQGMAPGTMPQAGMQGISPGGNGMGPNMQQSMPHGLQQSMPQGMQQGGFMGMPQRNNFAGQGQQGFPGQQLNAGQFAVQMQQQGMPPQQDLMQGMGMPQQQPGMQDFLSLPPQQQQQQHGGHQGMQELMQNMGLPQQTQQQQGMQEMMQGMGVPQQQQQQQGMQDYLGLPHQQPGMQDYMQQQQPQQDFMQMQPGLQQGQMPGQMQQQGLSQGQMQQQQPGVEMMMQCVPPNGMPQRGASQGMQQQQQQQQQATQGPQDLPQPRLQSKQSAQQQSMSSSAPSAGSSSTPQMAQEVPARRQSRGGLSGSIVDNNRRGQKERQAAGGRVTFGEAVDEQASVAWRPPAPGDAVAAAGRALSSEQLAEELEHISPSLPAGKAQQIEEVLSQVQALCQSCAFNLIGFEDPSGDAQLLPLGSHHLGVMQPGDEVDVLHVAPLNLQLRELVSSVRQQLEQRGDASLVRNAGSDGPLAAPGVAFTLQGVDVQLLFAQRIPNLPLPQGPQAIVQNTAGLLTREASERILSRVPSVTHFQQLLRFVRYWARQRGIYGHLGFLNGMAWAVCCARVCQTHPHLELMQLAVLFFQTFSRWDWRQPVALLSAGAQPPSEEMAPQPPPPQPVASSAAGDDAVPGPPNMSVLLPLESPLSATSNLTDTTAKIIQKELRRGYKMVQQQAGQLQRPHWDVSQSRPHWSDVYATAHFFQRHRHYLEFDFMASSASILASWLTWCRVQMQGLVRLFETTTSKLGTLRPWPEWIPFKDANWPHAQAVFVGLHLKRNIGQGSEGVRRSFDLREPIVTFLETVSTWPEADKYENQYELLIRHVCLSELQEWLDNQNKWLEEGPPQGEPMVRKAISLPLATNWTISEDADDLRS